MGREVRRVPANWQHPKESDSRGRDRYKPLHQDYAKQAQAFLAMQAEKGLQEALDYYGVAPNQEDYMPDWTEAECTHYQMYETCSEGTPISPVMESPEQLARWLADNGASSFGSMTATYEQWLPICQGGWAPSAVMSNGRIESGVAAMSSMKKSAD
jgi:hypothetical protein